MGLKKQKFVFIAFKTLRYERHLCYHVRRMAIAGSPLFPFFIHTRHYAVHDLISVYYFRNGRFHSTLHCYYCICYIFKSTEILSPGSFFFFSFYRRQKFNLQLFPSVVDRIRRFLLTTTTANT